jgi:hypothetical protein
MESESVSYCGKYLCSQCAYHRGLFVEAAKRLVELAQRYQSLRLIAGNVKTFAFDDFLKSLEWLASQDTPCKGCRQGGGWSWWPDCPVRTCLADKHLDFCYQCPDFPCNRLLTGPLKERLQQVIDANRQIQEQGLERWAEELKKKYTGE